MCLNLEASRLKSIPRPVGVRARSRPLAPTRSGPSARPLGAETARPPPSTENKARRQASSADNLPHGTGRQPGDAGEPLPRDGHGHSTPLLGPVPCKQGGSGLRWPSSKPSRLPFVSVPLILSLFQRFYRKHYIYFFKAHFLNLAGGSHRASHTCDPSLTAPLYPDSPFLPKHFCKY